MIDWPMMRYLNASPWSLYASGWFVFTYRTSKRFWAFPMSLN